MLHTHGLRVARLEVLVERGEDLRVEHLEPAHSVHHPLQVLEQPGKKGEDFKAGISKHSKQYLCTKL